MKKTGTNKRRKDNGAWEKDVLKNTLFLMIFFVLLICLFFVGDWLDWAELFNLHLRFDWAANFSMFLSAFASIVLGSVAVVQNKRAEEMNKQLAKINRDQFEASAINNNYPMIKFCDLQRVDNDNGNKKFIFKFFDTRNVPLKEAYTRNIAFVPLTNKYKEDGKPRRISMRKEEKRNALQFTYLHEGIVEGIYMIAVPVKEEMFNDYRYCRVEIEMDLISTTGVVTRCKGCALLDSRSKHKGIDNREYPYVYHQFFEIREIMSENKFKKGLKSVEAQLSI